MSQSQLADTLDVTRTIVSAWENDHRQPRPDHLGALADALGDDGELAALSAHNDGGNPQFETPIQVSKLLRLSANGLIRRLSEDRATDGRPGYGWRHDIDDANQDLSALSSAYGLKAVMLASARDWRVSLPRVREMLRRLELPDGGWSLPTSSPRALPEFTAVIVSALHDAGESDEYVREKTELVVDMLDRRGHGQAPARPYVLATALIELSQLPLDDMTGKRLVDDLVSLSIQEGGVRSWRVAMKASVLGRERQSPVHTAAAVCAVEAWARRLDDNGLRAVARSGRAWLEQNADLDLDDESLVFDQADGSRVTVQVRHFTPAWVVRALAESGDHSASRAMRRAMRATVEHYSDQDALWRWPGASGMYPVWMTYHAVAALQAWAGSHEIT